MLFVVSKMRLVLTLTAISSLKTMYEKTDDESIKEILATSIEALTGVLILENAISQFTARVGRPLYTLKELVSKGILKKLPQNPYGRLYTYENGQIGF